MSNDKGNSRENELTTNEYFAALDIGSNSFHYVLTRIVAGELQVLHSEKYRVQLAAGLDENKNITDEAMLRASKVLTSLTTTTKQLTRENFRIVATHTLREAKNVNVFLKNMAAVFPFDIEVISGHEEARLI
jgi:exopolyphosphatase/guanosine-5'-triphosphate,3'-diphosphate pyrophosphatase